MRQAHIDLVASTLKEDRLTNFSHFCDAKLLDFVTTEAVLSTRYTKRPTPFSLVKNITKQKDILKILHVMIIRKVNLI